MVTIIRGVHIICTPNTACPVKVKLSTCSTVGQSRRSMRQGTTRFTFDEIGNYNFKAELEICGRYEVKGRAREISKYPGGRVP